jgi:hypothetical protein
MTFTMNLPLSTMEMLCHTLLTSSSKDNGVCSEALKQTIQVHLRQSPVDCCKLSKN